ncbi:MAG: transposase family protein [Wenzhouxiangellaceae bacterium]|nr:transposase family protein [Wenzhouxiangellaceae bacterium]MBS3746630.1 transposase family protein [Wenzhouxiangellaceae bacterium]MBS3823444.1 transposase family protein [Wenzhouxiangellaceae bacterium]
MGRGEGLLASLGGWPGFEIADFECKGGDPEEIWITLRRKPDEPLCCDECGREASRIQEYQERVARDLPLFDAPTYLRIESCRVWCEHCGGPKRLRIDPPAATGTAQIRVVRWFGRFIVLCRCGFSLICNYFRRRAYNRV